MRKILIGTLLCLASVAHAASNFTFSNDQGPYAVGLRVVQQYDFSRVFKGKVDLISGQPSKGERARPIQTLIWYPAQKGGKPVTYFDYALTAAVEEEFDLPKEQARQNAEGALKNFTSSMSAEQVAQETSRRMWAVRDAKPAPGKFPLIVYAPSFSAPAHENADLCEYLASQGYIVIASPDMGSHTRGMTMDLDGIEAQAGDIEFLIGYAHSLPEVDIAHIAVVGFSWGGISNVFAAAKDSRISALVDLDGSVRYFPKLVTDSKYVTPTHVTIPMLYLAARPRSIEELITQKQDLSSSFLSQMKYSDVYEVTMYPMVHQNFSSTFLTFAPSGNFTDYTREEVNLAYSWMARYVEQFLNAYLKGDAGGIAFLNNSPSKNSVPAHFLSVDVHHAAGAPPTLEVFAGELGKRGFEHADEIYQELHKRDATFKPDEANLNSWGYGLLARNKNGDAIAILELATKIYPESGNAFDSLGEAYERNKDKVLSIKNYQRSLELTPDNHNAVQHLQAMGVAVSEHAKD